MPTKLTKKFDRNNLVRNLARRYKLVTHLDRALADFDNQWEFQYEPKEADDAWHPSGDCTPDARDLYAKAIGESEPINFNKKNGMVGQFWHQYLQWIVLHELEFCDEESVERKGQVRWDSCRSVEPKPYCWATGAADIAPCHIPNHGDFVVDFKTMGSHDFRRDEIPNWCADKYEAQINIYMDFFDIDRGLIVAINKDSGHDMKEFEYERNQNLIDAIYNKWKWVGDCLDRHTPPENEFNELPFLGPIV